VGALLLLTSVVMLGWVLKITPAVRVQPHYAPMVFNTAFCFALAGTALLLPYTKAASRATNVLGVALVLLSGLALAPRTSGIDLRVDWVSLHAWLRNSSSTLSRTGDADASAFLVAGLALIFSARRRYRWMEIALHILTFAVGAIGVLGLVGYLINAQLLFPGYWFSGVTIHTAVGLVVLAAGLHSYRQRFERSYAASELVNEQRNIVKWYGTSADSEDRKRAEEASRQAAEELQALSRQLVELQESERKALARELHDRLGETLTGLSINLAMLKESVQGDARATTRLEDSAALLKSTAAIIENMVAELRPPMLDDQGLAAAIEWHAKQFTRRVGVAVSLRAAPLGERIAPEVETALFRIAQEALNNVAKHARAEHVAITLWRSQSELMMSIADDGIGLPRSAQAPERPGLGLVTMRERAQAVGGAFKVEPLPDGAGTRLTVRIAL